MLKRIELHNFLSYEHVIVDDLDKGQTIAVIGDNGHGKSAFLEAVPYALFGEGRVPVGNLVRENGDGSMVVTVVFEQSGDVVVVHRGRRASGQGFAYVFVNDEKVAIGSAVEKWAAEYFGVTAEGFLLTTFFGLGATDSLMKVRPSVRLETLQGVANVSVYPDVLHPAANKRLKECTWQISGLETRIDSLKPYVDTTPLHLERKEARVKLLELNNDLDALYAKQTILTSESDRYNALIKERDALNIKRSDVKRRLSKVEKDLKASQDVCDEAKSASSEYAKEIAQYEEVLKGADLSKLKERAAKLAGKKGKYLNEYNLREVATQGEKSTRCPLCHSAVGEDIMEKWKVEQVEYREKLSGVEEQLSLLQKEITALEGCQAELRQAKAALGRELKDVSGEDKQISILTVEKNKVAGEYKRLEDRFIEVTRQLNKMEGATEDRGLIEKKIARAQEMVGSYKQKIDDLTNSIAETSERKKLYDALVKEKKTLRRQEKALSVVVEAFSRYGIPVDLLRGLCRAIESQATAIYRQFDAGQIVIEEVQDKGRPGVEFWVRNRTGSRSYPQLSDGQKVMLFFSVRLAIAKILMQAKGLDLDFLVLDELTSHLSENKREELAVLINSILTKSFSQVFMVSHAAIRDIFSTNLYVEMVNDTSTIRVQ